MALSPKAGSCTLASARASWLRLLGLSGTFLGHPASCSQLLKLTYSPWPLAHAWEQLLLSVTWQGLLARLSELDVSSVSELGQSLG